MARRSDHTREELRNLLIECGHAHLAEVGLARFSGREVAKRAGYSVGTIYNVFGSLDGLICAINSHSFTLWAALLRDRLETDGPDRIQSLVRGYFDFALSHAELWSAIYAHRFPDGFEMPDADRERRLELTRIVEAEIAGIMPDGQRGELARLAGSLIATVHGHCSFLISESAAFFADEDPVASALQRVREILHANGARPNG